MELLHAAFLHADGQINGPPVDACSVHKLPPGFVYLVVGASPDTTCNRKSRILANMFFNGDKEEFLAIGRSNVYRLGALVSSWWQDDEEEEEEETSPAPRLFGFGGTRKVNKAAAKAERAVKGGPRAAKRVAKQVHSTPSANVR